MELHSPVIATKRLWKFLRTTLLIISKWKMLKRGKLLRKSLSNLITFISKSNRLDHRNNFQAYEFSCRNSPANNLNLSNSKGKHSLYYLSCINSPQVDDLEPNINFKARFDDPPPAAAASSPLLSPLSVRVSNYSSLEYEVGNGQVDDQAEEFIRKFYEQLRMQSRMQFLVDN